MTVPRPITIIKIGTTTLTTPEGSLDIDNLSRLVAQLAEEAALKRRHLVLVSSGAITCGAEALMIKPISVPEKQAAASVGQALLMGQYIGLFRQYGIRVGQLLLTKDCMENRVRRTNTHTTLFNLLAHEVIPIINENDTVATDEIGVKFGDNDELSGHVAELVRASEMLILSDIDGLFTANPKTTPDATLIPELFVEDQEWGHMVQDIPNGKSRGGMLSKLTHAVAAAKSGVRVVIANGRGQDVLPKFFAGDAVGTRLVAS